MKDYISFIGLGQCGMRLCNEFYGKGYTCSFINSDEGDVRGFNFEPEKVLVLKGTGTGKSLKVGTQIVEDNKTKFESFLKKNVNKNGLTILVAGAGGGTGGSFVSPAATFLKENGYKVGVLLTLPPSILGLVPAENSLKTLKELKQHPLDFFMLIDNQMLLDELGSSTSWWGRVNKKIVENVLAMFEILNERKVSKEGLGSIDKGELIRCLTYGKGHIDVNHFYLTPVDFNLPDKELEAKIFKSPLTNGYNYREGLCYSVCVDIPKPFETEHMALASRIFNITKNKIGRGISIPGMFTDPMMGSTVRVTLIVAGLSLPKVLESRIKNLKRDNMAFKEKHNKVDKISADILDSLDEEMLDEEFTFK